MLLLTSNATRAHLSRLPHQLKHLPHAGARALSERAQALPHKGVIFFEDAARRPLRPTRASGPSLAASPSCSGAARIPHFQWLEY